MKPSPMALTGFPEIDWNRSWCNTWQFVAFKTWSTELRWNKTWFNMTYTTPSSCHFAVFLHLWTTKNCIYYSPEHQGKSTFSDKGITSIRFRLLFPCLLSTGGRRHLRLAPLLRNFPKLGQEHGCALCGRHLSRLFGHGNCNVFLPVSSPTGRGMGIQNYQKQNSKKMFEGWYQQRPVAVIDK